MHTVHTVLSVVCMYCRLGIRQSSVPSSLLLLMPQSYLTSTRRDAQHREKETKRDCGQEKKKQGYTHPQRKRERRRHEEAGNATTMEWAGGQAPDFEALENVKVKEQLLDAWARSQKKVFTNWVNNKVRRCHCHQGRGRLCVRSRACRRSWSLALTVRAHVSLSASAFPLLSSSSMCAS